MPFFLSGHSGVNRFSSRCYKLAATKQGELLCMSVCYHGAVPCMLTMYVSDRNGGGRCSSRPLFFPCSSLEQLQHFTFNSFKFGELFLVLLYLVATLFTFNSFKLGEPFFRLLLMDFTTMAASLWLLLCLLSLLFFIPLLYLISLFPPLS